MGGWPIAPHRARPGWELPDLGLSGAELVEQARDPPDQPDPGRVGVVHCVNPCDELEPADVCDATCTSGSAPGFVYCEIEADQPSKQLRATLINVTTGAGSEAR
jgi:hypothetical protein